MITPESTDIILSITGLAMTTVLTLVGWMLKQGKDNMKDIADGLRQTSENIENLSKEQAALKVTLVGINGNNGINSEVKYLRRKVSRLSKMLSDLKLTLVKDGHNILSPPEK